MKSIIVVCLVGIAAILAGAYLLRTEMQKSAELLQKNDTLTESLRAASLAHARLDGALTLAAQKNAATARKQVLAGASLAKNLEAASTWADTPVPKEVQDALKD